MIELLEARHRVVINAAYIMVALGWMAFAFYVFGPSIITGIGLYFAG